MNMIHTVCNQIYNLVSSICNPCLLHCPRIITEPVNDCPKPLRQNGSRQAANPCNLLLVGNRHDSWKHRNRNAFFTDSIQEIIEDIVIKKHLGGQKIHSAVNFMLQIPDVILLMLCLYMALRITGGADTELPLLTDILNQLTGIAIMAWQRELTL